MPGSEAGRFTALRNPNSPNVLVERLLDLLFGHVADDLFLHLAVFEDEQGLRLVRDRRLGRRRRRRLLSFLPGAMWRRIGVGIGARWLSWADL
jgi:hypothetical protein